MKFSYKFSNLLGTVYRSGDLLFTKDGNTLLCPVGNKISMYDLANNRSITLPIEARFNYSSLALSPNGYILLAIQEDGEMHIINLGLKNIIYRKRLYGNIRCIKFSPNGKYFAVCKENCVFVYNSPSCNRKVYDPFSLERVYESAYDTVLSLDWSYDSRFLCFGSQDMSVRVCAFTRFENFVDFVIGSNVDSVVGTYFEANSYDICTVTKNGIVSRWTCSYKANDFIVSENKYKKVAKETEEEDDIVNNENSVEDKKEKAKEKHKKHKQYKKDLYKRTIKMPLNKFFKGSNSISVTSTSYKKENCVLIVAFASGDFLILDMTDQGSLIHSLNISQKSITGCCINPSGDWVALGVSSLGELLVWEWQSESHVLKQQGHFNNMRVVCYSPDGLYLATGGEDGKVKIWNTQSSFCFVTFSEHTSCITGVTFTQSGKAVLSSSLDGTVRAFDMTRYRNFKTLTTPKPTQFSCLTVDSSGELVAAGGQDTHDIFLWSLQTGSLLEILGGHTGSVVSVQFSHQIGSTKLISTAWDKTVKIWDAISNTTAKETVSLMSDGTFAAFSMDGEQFAVATMNGHLTMFNSTTLRQEKMIEGRNDLGAGREDSDKVTSETNLKAKFFNSISYSPDGKYIIAAGDSKNVCIYSIQDELLIKKFEITQNRSLDAMDKTVRRMKLAENDVNLNLVEEREEERNIKAPGAMKGTLSQRTYYPQVRVTSLTFSKTGRSWAACTTEGLLIYSLDDDWLFDPILLEASNTPEAVKKNLRDKKYSLALMMACRLNIKSLTQEVMESIPVKSISIVVDSLSQIYVELVLKIIPEVLEKSKHLGFYSYWVSTLVTKHGQRLKERSSLIVSDLNAVQKTLTTHFDNLGKVCSHNEYMLRYMLCQASLKREKSNAVTAQSDLGTVFGNGEEESSEEDERSDDVSDEEML